MKRGYLFGAALLMAAVTTTSVWAAPPVNGAKIDERIFNDCPGSTVTVVNAYPATISIDDANVDCFGFANMHAWTLSSDGGASNAAFQNADQFVIGADMVISGTGQGEAGLRISPWWSNYTDGLFNVRTTDGEIAVFGGRLPFYSFSNPAGHNLRYTKGLPIRLEMNYSPNGLSMESPAVIEYKLTYNGNQYSSGALTFDQGNPAEDPPHGQWGILNPAFVGGHMKAFLSQGNPATAQLNVTWSNVVYAEEKPVPVKKRSWGQLKTLYR